MTEKPLCGTCDIGENTACTCDQEEVEATVTLDELEDAGQIPLFYYSEKDPLK